MLFKLFILGLHFENVTMSASEGSSQSPLMTKQISIPPRTVLPVTIPWYSHPVQLRNQQISIDEWTDKGLVSDIAELTDVWSSS